MPDLRHLGSITQEIFPIALIQYHTLDHTHGGTLGLRTVLHTHHEDITCLRSWAGGGFPVSESCILRNQVGAAVLKPWLLQPDCNGGQLLQLFCCRWALHSATFFLCSSLQAIYWVLQWFSCLTVSPKCSYSKGLVPRMTVVGGVMVL